MAKNRSDHWELVVTAKKPDRPKEIFTHWCHSEADARGMLAADKRLFRRTRGTVVTGKCRAPGARRFKRL